MGVSGLPKTVTRQRRGCDLNPGPSAPEFSTLTTRLPSHPWSVNSVRCVVKLVKWSSLRVRGRPGRSALHRRSDHAAPVDAAVGHRRRDRSAAPAAASADPGRDPAGGRRSRRDPARPGRRHPGRRGRRRRQRHAVAEQQQQRGGSVVAPPRAPVRQPFSRTGNVRVNVKVAHTRLPSAGFRSRSRFLAVSLQMT